MIKSEYFVLGVMSGTSLDGIDLALTKFELTHKWRYQLLTCETVPYSKNWTVILSNLTNISDVDLHEIDIEYTRLLADVINEFISKNNIENIDFIASHGHTAKHDPSAKITYQIGNLKNLALLTKRIVVCDFRTQDVAFNGQGAPLVPIGDKLLFSDYDFCLNLGGFANVSFEENQERIAYDVCPVNIVLNHYVKKLGLDYDDKGKIAAEGAVNKELFDELNALKFYHNHYPKSLGFEWVKAHVFPKIDSFNLETKDILRTFVSHIAYQISKEINKKSHSKVLITGGGSYNDFLISEIKKMTSNIIVIPDEKLIEYKEALIFGLLGLLRIRNENNCLASVTGAIKDHSSGTIHYP